MAMEGDRRASFQTQTDAPLSVTGFVAQCAEDLQSWSPFRPELHEEADVGCTQAWSKEHKERTRKPAEHCRDFSHEALQDVDLKFKSDLKATLLLPKLETPSINASFDAIPLYEADRADSLAMNIRKSMPLDSESAPASSLSPQPANDPSGLLDATNLEHPLTGIFEKRDSGSMMPPAEYRLPRPASPGPGDPAPLSPWRPLATGPTPVLAGQNRVSVAPPAAGGRVSAHPAGPGSGAAEDACRWRPSASVAGHATPLRLHASSRSDVPREPVSSQSSPLPLDPRALLPASVSFRDPRERPAARGSMQSHSGRLRLPGWQMDEQLAGTGAELSGGACSPGGSGSGLLGGPWADGALPWPGPLMRRRHRRRKSPPAAVAAEEAAQAEGRADDADMAACDRDRAAEEVGQQGREGTGPAEGSEAEAGDSAGRHGGRKLRKISPALARGMWRWRDGNQARKRRRRNFTSCDSSNVSGHASDRMGQAYASDALGLSAASFSVGGGRLSDGPEGAAGHSSSSELYYSGHGGLPLPRHQREAWRRRGAVGARGKGGSWRARGSGYVSGSSTGVDMPEEGAGGRARRGSANPSSEAGFGSDFGCSGDERVIEEDRGEEGDDELDDRDSAAVDTPTPRRGQGERGSTRWDSLDAQRLEESDGMDRVLVGAAVGLLSPRQTRRPKTPMRGRTGHRKRRSLVVAQEEARLVSTQGSVGEGEMYLDRE